MRIINQFVRVLVSVTDLETKIEVFERRSLHKYGEGILEASKWLNHEEQAKLASLVSSVMEVSHAS